MFREKYLLLPPLLVTAWAQVTSSEQCQCPWSQMHISTTIPPRFAQSLSLGRSSTHVPVNRHIFISYIGLSTRWSSHVRGTRSHQEGRQTAERKDRVSSAVRRPSICLPIPPASQEAPKSGYHAMHTGAHCRRSDRCVDLLRYLGF